MGWKGTLRSMGAAARAAERESIRRHKQSVKLQMIEDSATAVGDWENYVHDLISIHANISEAIDWKKIASKAPPSKPQLTNRNRRTAQAAFENFRPSFMHVFSGGSKKQKRKLEDEISNAALRDQNDFEERFRKHAVALEDWENDIQMARRLVAGELDAMRQVIEEMQSLSQNDLIGSAINYSFSLDLIHARPVVHGDEIVPSMRRKQLASGKLSESKMPKGQFNELYQDYVSSVALKTAGDLFNILPHDEVFVTCFTEMLNRQTGHQESTPILSVQFIRDTYARLNLVNVDPSDSMANFNHNMKFSKTAGFSAIEPLKQIS